MSVIDTLIYDRTAQHVSRLEALTAEINAAGGVENAPAEILGEWRYGGPVELLDSTGAKLTDITGETLDAREGIQRGAYNASDLNRVEDAVDYLVSLLQGAGYAVAATPPVGWNEESIPTLEQMRAYLDNVTAVRSALAVTPSTPPVPSDMTGLDWQKANDIERILADVSGQIELMHKTVVPCGEALCGEDYL